METITLPEQFETFICQKLQKNCLGGRPHLLKEISENADPKDKLLDILELVWLKNRSIGSIARKYQTSYKTIWRILKDLEPWKSQIILFLETVPRRKVFYNRDADSSDYEAVQVYIKRAKRDQLKTYKRNIMLALKCWRHLKYKDPGRWTAEDVHQFLSTKPEGSQSRFLDCIRMVAPQIADKNSPNYVRTDRFREKLRLRKKDLFSTEIKMVIEALECMGLSYHAAILKTHITIGAREGKGGKSGLTGISWNRFKRNFTKVDDYERKVRGGIWWRNCPVDLFWGTLPQDLKKIWTDRGRPSTDKLILKGYPELLNIYHEIRTALAKHFKGKLDPSLYEEFITLRPHDADKIHVNLLWEAEIPLEVVAGQYLGRGEGLGLMGRGWLDINTIKKHYLSLTERSERFQKLRNQVRIYSERFNEKLIFQKMSPESVETKTMRKRALVIAVC